MSETPPPIVIDLAAIAASHQTLVELWLALIGHLYDRGQVAPASIAQLLRNRIAVLSKEPGTANAVYLIEGQIDWLDRLGTGKTADPPVQH